MKQYKITDKREYYRTIYLQSDHWKQLKAEKLKETPFCSLCKTTKHLDVHHLNYKSLFDVTLQDLQVLCRRHHVAAHEKIRPKQRQKGFIERKIDKIRKQNAEKLKLKHALLA